MDLKNQEANIAAEQAPQADVAAVAAGLPSDLSPDELMILEQIMAEEAATTADGATSGENINQATATAVSGAPEQPLPQNSTASSGSAVEALIQQLAQQQATQQNSIAEMLRNQNMQSQQSTQAIQQLLNPPQEPSPEEQLIQKYMQPLQQQNQQVQQQLEQMRQEADRAKAEAFEAQQHAAVSAMKAKYADFDPKVAGQMMQPFIRTLESMGMEPGLAQQVVLKQFGNEQGLEILWRTKKFDDIMARAKKQKPDTHIPGSNMPKQTDAVMQQLMSEDAAAQSAAINNLWGD